MAFLLKSQLSEVVSVLRCTTRCRRATQLLFGTLPPWRLANRDWIFATSFWVMDLALVDSFGVGLANLDIAISVNG